MSVLKMKKPKDMRKLGTEIGSDHRLATSEKLSSLLSTTYILYHKTQALHWNVTGPQFYSVHNLTEDHYKDMAAAIDTMAERIRALGSVVPTGLIDYVEAGTIAPIFNQTSVEGRLAELAHDHVALADEMRGVVNLADKCEDKFTADLLTSRIGFHEEAAWMLNAQAQI